MGVCVRENMIFTKREPHQIVSKPIWTAKLQLTTRGPQEREMKNVLLPSSGHCVEFSSPDVEALQRNPKLDLLFLNEEIELKTLAKRKS